MRRCHPPARLRLSWASVPSAFASAGFSSVPSPSSPSSPSGFSSPSCAGSSPSGFSSSGGGSWTSSVGSGCVSSGTMVGSIGEGLGFRGCKALGDLLRLACEGLEVGRLLVGLERRQRLEDIDVELRELDFLLRLVVLGVALELLPGLVQRLGQLLMLLHRLLKLLVKNLGGRLVLIRW